MSCPLSIPAWEQFLAAYPDCIFVQSLLHIIQFGANVSFVGPSQIQICKNLRSAFEHPAVIAKDIAYLADFSRIWGHFPSPPLANFHCSPLGVVSRSKHQPHKFCVINHLSWLEGASVNDTIPDMEASIEYNSFECTVKDICSLGLGTLLAKLKDSFSMFPFALLTGTYLGLCGQISSIICLCWHLG